MSKWALDTNVHPITDREKGYKGQRGFAHGCMTHVCDQAAPDSGLGHK